MVYFRGELVKKKHLRVGVILRFYVSGGGASSPFFHNLGAKGADRPHLSSVHQIHSIGGQCRLSLRGCEKMGTGSATRYVKPRESRQREVPVPIFSQALRESTHLCAAKGDNCHANSSAKGPFRSLVRARMCHRRRGAIGRDRSPNSDPAGLEWHHHRFVAPATLRRTSSETTDIHWCRVDSQADRRDSAFPDPSARPLQFHAFARPTRR